MLLLNVFLKTIITWYNTQWTEQPHTYSQIIQWPQPVLNLNDSNLVKCSKNYILHCCKQPGEKLLISVHTCTTHNKETILHALVLSHGVLSASQLPCPLSWPDEEGTKGFIHFSNRHTTLSISLCSFKLPHILHYHLLGVLEWTQIVPEKEREMQPVTHKH